MQYLTAHQLRKKFVDFFAKNNHTPVHSASLIPAGDKTLLFTNAGMVPFKDVFLGYEKRDYKRAVSIQRCLRVGGKHNDLENVGYTARHHTFFEMLGNFSFGDYFKEKAIALAWDFLTVELAIPKSKLWITVHYSDDEAATIWQNNIGIVPERIIRCGDEDNFWTMGAVGPCGPCSEIFYDHGDSVAGGPPGSPEADGDRFIEIWNLVFMQYNRDTEGNQTPLPKPAVDTGMGLERLAAVMQHQQDNYATNELNELLKFTHSLTTNIDINNPSLRVLADHIRSCAFLIADGVLPSNEGRGYVLRRVIRRAIRHGNKLNITKHPFFYQLLQPLLDCMASDYPELAKAADKIEQVLRQEEERFSETLKNGLNVLQQKLEFLGDNLQIPGDIAFHLYDTYGFPVDLTADIAREKGLTVDLEGFDKAMQEQQQRARKSMKFNQQNVSLDLPSINNFTGYTDFTATEQPITALFDNQGNPVKTLEHNQQGYIVLAQSPFYSESGGQVSDSGTITSEQGQFQVKNTVKQGNTIALFGTVSNGELNLQNEVEATIEIARRKAIQRNHTATHLLHQALRDELGEHVEQKGSLVDENRLRFDFSHPQAITKEQLQHIEQAVNQQILTNHSVTVDHKSLDEAKQMGAMALFGEKYGDIVRVVKIADYSIELCGGTHVQQLGEIGLLKVKSEGAIASGIRRIEATTAEQALQEIDQQNNILNQLSTLLKAPVEQLEDKIISFQEKQKALQTQIETLQTKQTLELAKNQPIINVADCQLMAFNAGEIEASKLRNLTDSCLQRLENGIVVIAAHANNKGQISCAISKNLLSKITANELIKTLAAIGGGKGGGRKDFAMAGINPDQLENILSQTEQTISQILANSTT